MEPSRQNFRDRGKGKFVVWKRILRTFFLSVVVVLPVVLLLFTKTGNLYLLGNQEHYIYFFSICNLLFGEIAVSAFGIWGAMRPQNAQQHKRSWILTLLLGILWLSVGVFGLMS